MNRAVEISTLRPGEGYVLHRHELRSLLLPGDFAAIYNVNPVYQQNINGAGQTIALIGRARVYMPDIENFQMRSGLPTKDPIEIVPPGGVDPGNAVSSGKVPGDQTEATIDVTRATSVAPCATIKLVISGAAHNLNGIAVASQYVVDANPPIAEIMSMSFGGCEKENGQSGVALYDSPARPRRRGCPSS